MTSLRAKYNADMSAAIEEASVGFRKLAPGRTTTAMGLMRMCMGKIPDMPMALIEMIQLYMDFIDESALMEVLAKCEYHRRPWIRSLIIMAIGTDNLDLFLCLLESTGVWELDAFEALYAGAFDEFVWAPSNTADYEDFIQFITNLLCYLGRSGKESRWMTEFFREHSSVKFGIEYMVMGSGPVDAIQYNMELTCETWDPIKLLKWAMAGDRNPEILEFLKRPNRLWL